MTRAPLLGLTAKIMSGPTGPVVAGPEVAMRAAQVVDHAEAGAAVVAMPAAEAYVAVEGSFVAEGSVVAAVALYAVVLWRTAVR